MKIPESQHTTAQAIIKWYESKPQDHRPHMGASIIGHECERYIWNTWRWVLKPAFEGRMLRLFDSGVRAEPRFVEELRAIGAEVWDRDPDSGDQWRVSACNGHFGGSMDAVARGLPEAPKSPAIIEMKTHGERSFSDLVSKGVKASKPQHWLQMQTYLGLMQIDRALYLAENKNTSAVYTEWVHFEEDIFKQTLLKAQRLIDSTEPPPRINDDPSFFICKMCNFHPVCHGTRAADANCRTCCHATPVAKGAWQCGVHNTTLSDKKQAAGCDQHLMIPALVSYAEPIDGGDNYVVYRHRDSGVEFSNGPGIEPRFSSKDLQNCPAVLLPQVAEVKAAFPGSKVVASTVFDDMEDDDPDAAPSKKDSPVVREQRKRITKTLQALREFKV